MRLLHSPRVLQTIGGVVLTVLLVRYFESSLSPRRSFQVVLGASRRRGRVEAEVKADFETGLEADEDEGSGVGSFFEDDEVEARFDAPAERRVEAPETSDEDIGKRFLLRKERNIKGCQKIGGSYPGPMTGLLYSKEHRLLICAPKKCGCTTFRKQLLSLLGKEDVKILSAEAQRLLDSRVLLGSNGTQEALVSPSVIRVVSSRHPLDRLVSGYKDKFNNGEQVGSVWKKAVITYKEVIGGNTTDASLTFVQYLQMLIEFKYRKSLIDGHFRPVFRVCSPCGVNYDYIVDTSTLSEDLAYLARRFHLPIADPGMRANGKATSKAYEDYYKDVPRDVFLQIYDMFKMDFVSYGFEVPDALRGHLDLDPV